MGIGRVSIEWIVGIARHHPDDDGDFKTNSTYDISCFVQVDEGVAVVKGAVGDFKPSMLRQLREELAKVGIEKVTFTRVNHHKKRQVMMDAT